MRRLQLAFTFIFCTMTSSLFAQGSFNVNISAPGLEGRDITMITITDGKSEELAEVTITNGVADISVDAPELPRIFILFTRDGSNSSRTLLFGSEDDIRVEVSGEEVSSLEWSSTGGEYEEVVNQYLEIIAAANAQYQELYAPYNEANAAGDEETMEEISMQFEEVSAWQQDELLDLALDYPRFGAGIAMFELAGAEVDVLESILEKLDEEYIAGPGQWLADRVEVLHKPAIGSTLEDITLPNTDGEDVALSSLYTSEYTLIDFWASWCAPCRDENPNLVAEYNEYKDRGFNVVGISFDRDKKSWMDAIEADELNWAHLSDLNLWSSEAAAQYGIRAIPANFVVNREGVIVAKNLRGEELGEWLEDNLD